MLQGLALTYANLSTLSPPAMLPLEAQIQSDSTA
jgi:hypothetical protein